MDLRQRTATKKFEGHKLFPPVIMMGVNQRTRGLKIKLVISRSSEAEVYGTEKDGI
jgi:hypothetical protein